MSEGICVAGALDPVGDLGGTPLLVDATLPPPTDNEEPGCPRALGGFAGVPRFVDRLTISFPWTIKLSFDFLRSRVSISNAFHVTTYEWNRNGGNVPSPPISKSKTSPIFTFITPRNP